MIALGSSLHRDREPGFGTICGNRHTPANLCPFQCHVLEGVRRLADTFYSHHKRPKARPIRSACQACSTGGRRTTVRPISDEKKNDGTLAYTWPSDSKYWPVYSAISVAATAATTRNSSVWIPLRMT